MNKLKGYRNMMNQTQREWAKMLGISIVAYNCKETKKVPFTDNEKMIIKEHIKNKCKIDVTIDELFFW